MFSIVRVVQMKNIAHVCVCDERKRRGLKCGCDVGRECEKNKVNWNSICLLFHSSHLFSLKMKDED
jgi:hypothetical protein